MLILVKLTPKASRNAVHGGVQNAAGNKILKISVTAVPEKGKANKAMIELISKEFKIAKSAIRIVKGESERSKLLEISVKLPELG
jgi:uncharacterized protein (TIGR00251 family)